MSLSELLVVVGTMACLLLAAVPIGVASYRFVYRVKIRARRTMERLVEQLAARRGPVVGRPFDFQVRVEETQLRVKCTYSPASQTHGSMFRTGTMRTTVSAPCAGEASPSESVDGWQITSDGRSVTATTHGVPEDVESLDALLTLVAALAESDARRGVE